MTENERPPRLTEITPRGQSQAPLTHSQESMWFLQQLDPGNNAYNSNLLLKFTGGINHQTLEQALILVIARHEPLRTLYPNEGGNPVQLVCSADYFNLTIEDLSKLPVDETQRSLEKLISQLADEPYALETGPLFRSALFHLNPDEDVFFFGTHHIGSDAWSREVFQKELLHAYTAVRLGQVENLPPLPIQYTDYAIWQREWMQGETLSRYLDHWKQLLSGELPTLELPTDHPRPALQTFRGAQHSIPLLPELTAQIKAFCRQERITPFHFYLAAFAILLMRHSGQEDLVIGCPFANRPAPALENMVGLFINAMPIRLDLSADPSVHDLLDQVRRVMIDAFTWQALPFEALVSELSPERDLSRTPIFQVSINMRNILKQTIEPIEGLKVEKLTRKAEPTPLDLSLEFEEVGGELSAFLQYNSDLFEGTTISRMAGHYLNLVNELMRDPDSRISSLEMLSPSEWNQLVIDSNQNDSEFPQECMHKLVMRQVHRNPDKTALIFNGNSLTYQELNQKANQLANYLLQKGLKPGSFVGIYLHRSEWSIIAILAILKTGCAFVPVDFSIPSERRVVILEDCAPALILTDAHSASRLSPKFHLTCLDTESDAIKQCEIREPDNQSSLDAIMYLTYTSGSTGRPKGVLNEHRGPVNYLAYMVRTFGISKSDRMLQHTSLSFDASIFEIFVTLISGGTLVMLDDNQMSNPASIVHSLVEQKITIIKVVPTLLRAICESAVLIGTKKNHLRLLLAVGEPLLKKDLGLAHQAFGDSFQIINQYGPTECSGIYTNFVVPYPYLLDGLPSVPIGRPMSNCKTYLLDRYHNPVPIGVVGEMYLGGIGVGPGYLNQPEMTEANFLPDHFLPGGRMYKTGDLVQQLPDGNYCFIGRADGQVKIRGYRVELSEIEAVIAEYPGVKDAAVLLWKNEKTEILTAYITSKSVVESGFLDILKKHLAERLPFYMIPSVITILEELPLTTSGKIDRKQLPAPGGTTLQTSAVPPRNETEKRLLGIWETVLETSGFGVTDNFFQLGGHSLLAVRLMTAIQNEFNRSIPLILLFEEGTVEGLAKFLSSSEPGKSGGIVPINSAGGKSPIFIISSGLGMKYLGAELGTTHPVYALFPYENGQPAIKGSVQETAAVFYKNLTNFQAEGPYNLLGHSADGHFTLELARLLRNEGKEVGFLGLIDTYPPKAKQYINKIDRAKFYLKILSKKDFPGILKALQRSIKWRLRKLWYRTHGTVSIENWQRKGEVRRIKHFLIKEYRPEPFNGIITLFTASYAIDVTHEQLVRQWEKVVFGKMNIIPVVGDHLSIVQPPQVSELARKILEAIDRDEAK